MLDAWLNTGMSAPYTMVATTWGNAPTPATPEMWTDSLVTYEVAKRGALGAATDTFKAGDTVGIKALVVDEGLTPLSGAQLFAEVTGPDGSVAANLQEFTDGNGEAVLRWKTGRREASGVYTATVTDILKNGFVYPAGAGVTSVTFSIQ
jgi:hypothetical protein